MNKPVFIYNQTPFGLYNSKPETFSSTEERDKSYCDALKIGHGEFVKNCVHLEKFLTLKNLTLDQVELISEHTF